MKLDVIGIRLVKEREIESPNRKITTPKDIANIFINEMKDLDREMVMSLYTDVKGNLINAHVVSIGSIKEVVMDPKNVMKAALLSNASGVSLIHNHPTGICNPSLSDYSVTDRIKEACNIMGLTFLDHIVLGKDSYYSLAADQEYAYDEQVYEIEEDEWEL